MEERFRKKIIKLGWLYSSKLVKLEFIMFWAKFNLKQGYNRVDNILIVKKLIDNLDVLPSAALDSKFLFIMKAGTESGAKNIQRLLFWMTVDTVCKNLEIVQFREKVTM